MPGPRATRVGARARTAPDTVTVIGWAGDPKAKQPASKLIATVDGKVVGRTEPRLSRPDLVAYGLPKGFQQAGFQMQVPVARGARVRVFGVSQTGQLTEIVAQDRRPAHGTTRIGNRSVKLTPNAVWGQLNTTTHAHVVQIERPASTPWTDYRWLEVDAGPRGFHKGDFTVYDRRTRPSMGREISFQTLDDSPRRYIVPVASCSQWHAYRGRRLFINQDTPQHISAVRLIR